VIGKGQKRWGKKGFRKVREHFSSAFMVKKTEEVYKELLVKKR